jgi:hypothetical protein
MSAQVTGLCVGSVLTSPKRETLYMSTFSLVVSFPAICLCRWEVSCITYITTSRWLTSRVVLLLSLGSVQPSDLSSPLGILLLSLGAAGSEREELSKRLKSHLLSGEPLLACGGGARRVERVKMMSMERGRRRLRES